MNTHLSPFFVIPAALVSAVAADSVSAISLIRAEDYGVLPGNADNGAAMRKLLAAAREKAPCRIELQKGIYHFKAESALPMQMYISNHDQQPEHRVALPMVGMNKVEICGNGAKFIFHGLMLPVVVQDSRDITISDVSIDYAEPFSAEGRIVDIQPGFTTLEMSPASRYKVENGAFLLTNNGRRDKARVALAFEPDGRMVPTGLSGDIVWSAGAEQLSGNRVRFQQDIRKRGLSVGQTLVLRSPYRPHPAMLLYRAVNTKLNNVVFHDSQGMALLAQRSENITISGGGCLRAPGRMHTAEADATHFSNCRGRIRVKNATYEAMMDDAINVHATCLGIEQIIDSRTFVARYMHHQAIGFEVMAPGEQLQFIHGPTLELNPQLGKVQKVETIDPRHVRVTLENDIPAGIAAGDAVENADWHPSVDFRNNTIRHNRARGALFTTPKPVKVIKNHFDHSHGSAILLAGDAQGWYESGACRDVLIKNNIFRHSLTGLYQFTDAVIAICPEVRKPELQKKCYHRNVRIVNNYFITHRVPLLSARSAENVLFMRNKIKYRDIYPPVKDGEPYLLRHNCRDFKLQELK